MPSCSWASNLNFSPSPPLHPYFPHICPKSLILSSTRLFLSYSLFYCPCCPSSITAVQRFSYWVVFPLCSTFIPSKFSVDAPTAAASKAPIDLTTSCIAPTLCYSDAGTIPSSSVCTTVFKVLRALCGNQRPRNLSSDCFFHTLHCSST